MLANISHFFGFGAPVGPAGSAPNPTRLNVGANADPIVANVQLIDGRWPGNATDVTWESTQIAADSAVFLTVQGATPSVRDSVVVTAGQVVIHRSSGTQADQRFFAEVR